jgi:hypothetical protein
VADGRHREACVPLHSPHNRSRTWPPRACFSHDRTWPATPLTGIQMLLEAAVRRWLSSVSTATSCQRRASQHSSASAAVPWAFCVAGFADWVGLHPLVWSCWAESNRAVARPYAQAQRHMINDNVRQALPRCLEVAIPLG